MAKKAIIEGDGSQSLPAYDEQFRGYPKALKRFLPAAFAQVRRDPDSRGLEVEDPKVFRERVAYVAYRMARLSAHDQSPRLAPSASVLQSDPAPRPFAEEKSAMQESISPSGPDRRPILPPIRILAGEDGLFILRIGPETHSPITEAKALVRLTLHGVDPASASEWIALARHQGEVTVLTAMHELEDFARLDAELGSWPRPKDQV